jgi:hypothetical protein
VTYILFKRNVGIERDWRPDYALHAAVCKKTITAENCKQQNNNGNRIYLYT